MYMTRCIPHIIFVVCGTLRNSPSVRINLSGSARNIWKLFSLGCSPATALIAPAPGRADGEPAANFVTEIPHGYRDWQWISSAHEAGNLNSLGAVLGNDVAIKAYREGKLPFPDGSIIAALHYRNVPSDENNKAFGRVQSFVPGSPTNIQFMARTQQSTPQPEAGGSLTSKTANLATRLS